MPGLAQHLLQHATAFLEDSNTTADSAVNASAPPASDEHPVNPIDTDALNMDLENLKNQIATLKAGMPSSGVDDTGAVGDAPASTGETPDFANNVDMKDKLETLFGQVPKADPEKMSMEAMAKLRVAAFDTEDPEAARTWAANLGELKKSCFVDDALKPCQTLAQESMYMAAKYFQMWDESMSMWAEQEGEAAAAADHAADAAAGEGAEATSMIADGVATEHNGAELAADVKAADLIPTQVAEASMLPLSALAIAGTALQTALTSKVSPPMQHEAGHDHEKQKKVDGFL